MQNEVNEAPETPKSRLEASENTPGGFCDAKGSPKSALGVAWGGSWGSPGTVPSAPGLLWGTFRGAWDQHLRRFWMVFVPPGGVRRENGDMLEFENPLNEIVVFSRPQASQNGLELVPKRPERSKESREDANREQRGDKNALQSVRGALWGGG